MHDQSTCGYAFRAGERKANIYAQALPSTKASDMVRCRAIRNQGIRSAPLFLLIRLAEWLFSPRGWRTPVLRCLSKPFNRPRFSVKPDMALGTETRCPSPLATDDSVRCHLSSRGNTAGAAACVAGWRCGPMPPHCSVQRGD